MHRQEFIDWFKEFIENSPKNNYYANYRLKKDWHPNPGEFFDKVEKSHIYTRKVLGGLSQIISVDAEHNNTQIIGVTINPIISKLDSIVPQYREKYGLSRADFYFDKYPKRINSGIGVIKHILGYIKREKLSNDAVRKLTKLASELGAIYKRLATEKPKINFTISTDPRAFCMLGKYKIDSHSCFCENGMNTDKKYTYGIFPESFIFLGHNTPSVDLDPKSVENVIIRGLGTVTSKNKRVNCSNTYGADILSESYILSVASKLVNFKSPVIYSNLIEHKGGINYINANIYSILENTEKAEKEFLKFDPYYSKESHDGRDSYADWN